MIMTPDPDITQGDAITAFHLWYLRPDGEAVGLMLPGGEPVDVVLHVKEALDEGAISITILCERLKPTK